MSLYQEDGVNIEAGDSFSGYAGKICRESFNNSPYVVVHDLSEGHFRGPRSYSFRDLPEGFTIDAAPDGIGTKVVLIDAAKSYQYAPQDVIAMNCGGITRFGGLPLVFINVLDVFSLDGHLGKTNEAFRQMIFGLGEIAKKQNLVLLRGETAELGKCVGSENVNAITKFNWAGTTIGAYHPDKVITGNDLKAGQVVVALREHGFRSNGISSVRKALQIHFGDNWFDNPNAESAILAAAKPSVLYDMFLSVMNGWYRKDGMRVIRMHCIFHLTGGSIKSKFAEDVLFPRGLSADLDDLWDPPEIMRLCAVWRGMTCEEIYSTWNGGQGVLVVVDSEQADMLIAFALEQQIEAKVCGRITQESSSPCVTVKSKFSGKSVTYTM